MAKKTKSSLGQHGPYLAIVAVVAVVAIVFLILNFAGVSPVGEALRVPAAGVNVCQQGERCGFVTKDELDSLKADINKLEQEANGDCMIVSATPYSTGLQLCSNKGMNCRGVEFEIKVDSLGENDMIQAEDKYRVWGPPESCAESMLSIIEDKMYTSSGAEPLDGKTRQTEIATAALCCK